MALILQQVKDEVVAIEICELPDPVTRVPGGCRGCGTAFWAVVGDQPKLFTAGHIPWPQLKRSPPGRAPDNDVLEVKWCRVGNQSGSGLAAIYPHPDGATLDFATIQFIDPGDAPPLGTPFALVVSSPLAGTPVAGIGFPGNYTCPPVADCAAGVINGVVTGNRSNKGNIVIGGGATEIIVDGIAAPGFSGGPAFLALQNGDLGDKIVGLMRGAPWLPDGSGPDPTKFVLFGATSLK